MDSNRKIKGIAFNLSVKLKSIEYADKKTIKQNDVLVFRNAMQICFGNTGSYYAQVNMLVGFFD